ncbi:hypothetical protein [Kitasatospora sp. LaBMicrA B282]|uniref:hypothetical protein n=1 Tax=Kitasatospora sp. LaBMicrA B282 TaxID=3420949 RepID=UPI003D126605
MWPAGAAGSARDSLAGAAAVADRLPAELGRAVLVGAREAFTGGLHGAAIGASVLMLLGAVLAPVLLRGAGTPGDPGDGGGPA